MIAGGWKALVRSLLSLCAPWDARIPRHDRRKGDLRVLLAVAGRAGHDHERDKVFFACSSRGWRARGREGRLPIARRALRSG